MHTTFDNMNVPHLPSGSLWRGFAPPTSFGPDGTTTINQSGNPAFGFYDNFMSFHAATLDGPYRKLTGTGVTIDQVADTDTEKGLLQIALATAAANRNGSLQWGRGLSAPFKFAGKDLVFECRLAVSAITAAKWSWGVGLGAVAMGADNGFFANTTGALTDNNFLGFTKLVAAGAPISGSFKASGQTFQDGGTKSKLAALHTLVADEYVKLGFRYRSHPRMVEYYVNNKLAGTLSVPARLTQSEIAAATFPKNAFLAPVIGFKDIEGDTTFNIKLDWWACAQLL